MLGVDAADGELGPAVNGVLSSSDRELVIQAAQDRSALEQLCARYQYLVLAFALQETDDWDRAQAAVEPALKMVTRQLVAGRCSAPDWLDQLERAVVEQLYSQGKPVSGSAASSNGGIGNLPRIVKRRAVRLAMSEMSLAERVAVLMVSLAKRPAAEMVGIVAQSESEAIAVLAAAWDRLASQVRHSSEPFPPGDDHGL